jgi:hypothetical protein
VSNEVDIWQHQVERFSLYKGQPVHHRLERPLEMTGDRKLSINHQHRVGNGMENTPLVTGNGAVPRTQSKTFCHEQDKVKEEVGKSTTVPSLGNRSQKSHAEGNSPASQPERSNIYDRDDGGAMEAYFDELQFYSGSVFDPSTPYRFDFGKHKGLTIKEVYRINPGYIDWIIREDVSRNKVELRQALELWRDPSLIPECFREDLDAKLHTEPEFVSTRPSRQPPSIHNAPSAFHDSLTGPIWISLSDARKYFGLGAEILDQLPAVNGYNLLGEFVESTPQRPKYWLYHVWDLVRDRQSCGAANVALARFKQKNKRREQDIWDAMGLGPLC